MTPQLKLCLNPAETIVGFNYAFIQKLVEKADELNETGRLFKQDSSNPTMGYPSMIGASVLNTLCSQTRNGEGNDPFSQSGIFTMSLMNATINAAREFLTIFVMEE